MRSLRKHPAQHHCASISPTQCALRVRSEVEPVVAKPKTAIANLPVRHDDPGLAPLTQDNGSGLAMANATAKF
jgi:hypothetical protein